MHHALRRQSLVKMEQRREPYLRIHHAVILKLLDNSLTDFGKHIIPNSIGVIVVNVTFQVADAIVAVATLSFLGFGIAPPATNWGLQLSNGIAYVYAGYWWLIYPAGICIVLIVMAFNFVGDALRDALEVRLQRR